jgi:hypothetical protein
MRPFANSRLAVVAAVGVVGVGLEAEVEVESIQEVVYSVVVRVRAMDQFESMRDDVVVELVRGMWKQDLVAGLASGPASQRQLTCFAGQYVHWRQQLVEQGQEWVPLRVEALEQLEEQVPFLLLEVPRSQV